MSILVEPKDIMMEFIRAVYKEPTRTVITSAGDTAQSKFHTNTASETFSGNASDTTFTMANTKLLCINSVTVDAVAQVKYKDFDIDLRNNQIIFRSGSVPASGTDDIDVDYDSNTNGQSWVFSDKPLDSLSKTSYPRIGILPTTASSDYLGMSDDDTLDTVPFQIHVVGKEGVNLTDYKSVDTSGTATTITENVSKEKVVDILSRNIIEVIKRNARNNIVNALWNIINIGHNSLPFEENKGIFRHVLDYQCKAFNAGVLS